MKMTRPLAVLCAVLLLAAGLSLTRYHAQTKEPGFTLAQVLSAPFPTDLVAAPQGERIAWVFNWQGKRNVWVAEGPQFKARQLTQYDEDTGQELTELAFTHDGQWLVYVRGGNENSAGDVPNPTSDPAGAKQELYAVEFTSGRVVRLAAGESPVVSPVDNRVVFSKDGQLHIVEVASAAEPHQLFTARGNNISPQWSPDGKQLAFNSSRGTHSYIGVYDFDKGTIRYLAASVDRDSLPRWSPDGKRIGFIRQPARGNLPRPIFQDAPDPWAIMVVDATTNTSTTPSSTAREVWRSGTKPEDAPPRMAGENLLQWAADDRLVFASEMDGWMRLYSVSASGGVLTQLTPTNCEWEQMTLTPDKRSVVLSSNCGDINRRHIWRVNVVDGIAKAITAGTGIEWSPILTGNAQHLALIAANDKVPALPMVIKVDGYLYHDKPVYRVAPVARSASELLNSMDRLAPYNFLSEESSASYRTEIAPQLITPQTVTFKAADNLDIHGQLFLPKNAKPTDKLPAVIFMHGGPVRQMLLGWHNRYYYHNAYGFNQYLASRGYAVLSVNYRLGVGYGRAFRQAKNGGGRGASEYQDIVAAAYYLRARSDIDPSRIGLWGGSYGGYLTALGLARNSDLFAAGVDLHGVHDWSLRLSSAAWIDYADRDAVKIARESSPIGSMEKWRSPVLLIHGDDDRNVAFAQTVDLVRRLREQKVEHEVMVFPDEVHDFLLHRHWLEIYEHSAKFLDQHLKNKTAQPAAGQAAQRVSKLDLLIRGGSVIDGTGGNPIKADLGIAGDRIVFVGDATKENLPADRTIDATGLIVAPGFIDPHTHADEDLTSPQRKSNEPFLFQGVTTVVVGNDGRSPLPISKRLEQWQQQGIGTNALLLVGHGAVRGQVLGASDVQPTPEQLSKMKQIVTQAMDDGAFGMSTGLYYAPGSYAKTEEVIELAKIVGARGGIYDTHMRDESSYNIGLLGSINETIRIGREANLPVHISHIKALGTDVWGQSKQVIEVINAARRQGVNLTANQYPYTASGTSLTASLVPRWAEAGGTTQLLKRIDDPALRPRLLAEMEQNLKRRGGAESLLITSAKDTSLVGKRLNLIAKQRSKTPIEAALDIIKSGGAGVASFNMTEADIENFMRQEWVMTGSDGSGGHPRKYGTYPRKLRQYVLDRKIISLPRMIEASSRQVAQVFKLRERGQLSAGYFADIIVFDPQTVIERANYEQPERLAEGMKYVLVNGKLAIDGGKYTGALAGRGLRKSINGE